MTRSGSLNRRRWGTLTARLSRRRWSRSRGGLLSLWTRRSRPQTRSSSSVLKCRAASHFSVDQRPHGRFRATMSLQWCSAASPGHGVSTATQRASEWQARWRVVEAECPLLAAMLGDSFAVPSRVRFYGCAEWSQRGVWQGMADRTPLCRTRRHGMLQTHFQRSVPDSSFFAPAGIWHRLTNSAWYSPHGNLLFMSAKVRIRTPSLATFGICTTKAACRPHFLFQDRKLSNVTTVSPSGPPSSERTVTVAILLLRGKPCRLFWCCSSALRGMFCGGDVPAPLLGEAGSASICSLCRIKPAEAMGM